MREGAPPAGTAAATSPLSPKAWPPQLSPGPSLRCAPSRPAVITLGWVPSVGDLVPERHRASVYARCDPPASPHAPWEVCLRTRTRAGPGSQLCRDHASICFSAIVGFLFQGHLPLGRWKRVSLGDTHVTCGHAPTAQVMPKVFTPRGRGSPRSWAAGRSLSRSGLGAAGVTLSGRGGGRRPGEGRGGEEPRGGEGHEGLHTQCP